MLLRNCAKRPLTSTMHVRMKSIVKGNMFAADRRFLDGDRQTRILRVAPSLAFRRYEFRDDHSQALAGSTRCTGRTEQCPPKSSPASSQQLFVSRLRHSIGKTVNHPGGLSGQVRAWSV